MKRSTSDTAQRVSHLAYKLGDVMYVPHYRNFNVFVGPGYPRATCRRYTANELVNAGAKPVDQMMWPRGEHGIITDGNL